MANEGLTVEQVRRIAERHSQQQSGEPFDWKSRAEHRHRGAAGRHASGSSRRWLGRRS